jgi:hypothetical protein
MLLGKSGRTFAAAEFRLIVLANDYTVLIREVTTMFFSVVVSLVAVPPLLSVFLVVFPFATSP